MDAIVKAFASDADTLENASLIVAGIIRGKGGIKMESIDDFITIAKNEMGYKETPINITKYNEWADSVSIWFTKVQGLAWCTSFVAWCINELSMKYLFTLDDFCVDSNCCWSDHWMDNFKKAKRFFDMPQAGDLAFKNGHVGIVADYNPKSFLVQVIEGNVSDSVQNRWHAKSSWLGFGRPNWGNFWIPANERVEAASAKEFVINQGIYIGKSDGEMHWSDNLTREEMALILYRYWKKFNK